MVTLHNKAVSDWLILHTKNPYTQVQVPDFLKSHFGSKRVDSFYLLLLLLLKILFIYFLERGEGEGKGKGRRKRWRETSMHGCLSHAPYRGPGLQPRLVP